MQCKGRITEKRFRKWLALEPQTLVWLSTLHRLAISETSNEACLIYFLFPFTLQNKTMLLEIHFR